MCFFLCGQIFLEFSVGAETNGVSAQLRTHLSAISTVFLKRNTVELADKMGLKEKKHSIVVGTKKVILDQGNHIALLCFSFTRGTCGVTD